MGKTIVNLLKKIQEWVFYYYVVTYGVEYEREEIVGVFSTEKKADRAIEILKYSGWYNEKEFYVTTIQLDEYRSLLKGLE